jgi:hypothetical protein
MTTQHDEVRAIRAHHHIITFTAVRSPAKTKDFSLLYSIYTGSGAHKTPYKKGTRDCFSELKVAGV